jgi:Ulp1 family protease
LEYSAVVSLITFGSVLSLIYWISLSSSFDLSKRLILAPVVISYHWSLLAILNPSNIKGKNTGACSIVLHLDSLPGIHNTADVCAAMESKMWLQNYHQQHTRKGTKLQPTEVPNQLNAYLNDTNRPSLYLSYKISVQPNGYDCAIYTLACLDEIMHR